MDITRIPRSIAVATLLTMAQAAQAASPAAIGCPPYYLLSGELAANPGFELPTAGILPGSVTCWSSGGPANPASAAAGWRMHSDNFGAPVCSRLVPSSTPGPHGLYMLQFHAGGREGGVYQVRALDPRKSYMFSAWVLVRRGQVGIASRSMVGGPYAFTTKHGQWEQLRVCTNGLANTDNLIVYNQDPAGGVFYLDRVELREIPTLD